MKHTLLWLGILSNVMLFSEDAFAETLLKGQVTLRDKNGEAVNNAQISAIVGKANPVSTDSDGVFTLEFLDKDTGQKIKITCAKSGFDVVNWYDLEPRLPDNPDASDALLQVVMCPHEGVSPSSCAVAYISRYLGYNFDANFQNDQQKIQQEYEEKLQQLEASARDKANLAEMQQELLNAKNAQIAELEKKYETLLVQKEEWAKQFAEYDPATATDEMYKEALRLFQDNKLDEAIAVLDDAKIQADLQRAQTQAANRYRLKAQSYVAKFDFANAEKYYQLAIDADPESFDNLHEVAFYLQEQNQLLDAQPLFTKALQLAKNDSDIAKTLINLGGIYWKQNQFEKTIELSQKALRIYKKLALERPETYQKDIAAILHNLGLSYRHLNQHDLAVECYNNALELREELAKKNPQSYLPDVAITLNNLGILYMDLKQYDQSIITFQRALQLYENIANAKPEIYNFYVAGTLHNLGGLYAYMNKYDQTIDSLQRALCIRNELATLNPEAYQADVAATLNNLGLMYADLGQYNKAENAIKQALMIRKALADENPQAYELDLGGTMFNLSMLYRGLCESNIQQGFFTLYQPLSGDYFQNAYKTQGLDLAESAITILQKYPNVPKAQEYIERAEQLRCFFEQAGE